MAQSRTGVFGGFNPPRKDVSKSGSFSLTPKSAGKDTRNMEPTTSKSAGKDTRNMDSITSKSAGKDTRNMEPTTSKSAGKYERNLAVMTLKSTRTLDTMTSKSTRWHYSSFKGQPVHLKSSKATCAPSVIHRSAKNRMERWCKSLFLVVVLILMAFSDTVSAKVQDNSGNLQWMQAGRRCPMAFHEIGTKCYFYGYFPLNWYRAAEFCHSFGRGVSLASIESAQENYYLKQWLSINGNHNTGVWIGGSDNGHHGRWAWFPTGQLVEFSNWGPSQPSGDDQHCMYMVGGLLGYQWADFHCGFDMHFLCEEDVNDIEPW